MPQARYTLHIPKRHKEGHEMPLVLDSVRSALNHAGLKGHTVVRSAEAHNDTSTQPIDIVYVDGEDDAATDEAIKAVCQGFKSVAGHPAVYVIKQPITTWLV